MWTGDGSSGPRTVDHGLESKIIRILKSLNIFFTNASKKKTVRVVSEYTLTENSMIKNINYITYYINYTLRTTHYIS